MHININMSIYKVNNIDSCIDVTYSIKKARRFETENLRKDFHKLGMFYLKIISFLSSCPVEVCSSFTNKLKNQICFYKIANGLHWRIHSTGDIFDSSAPIVGAPEAVVEIYFVLPPYSFYNHKTKVCPRSNPRAFLISIFKSGASFQYYIKKSSSFKLYDALILCCSFHPHFKMWITKNDLW